MLYLAITVPSTIEPGSQSLEVVGAMQRVSIIFVFAFLSPHIHAAEQTDDRETETQQSRKYRGNSTEAEIQNTGTLGTKTKNETQIEELKNCSKSLGLKICAEATGLLHFPFGIIFSPSRHLILPQKTLFCKDMSSSKNTQ